MPGASGPQAAEVLLVEDDPGDVLMIKEAFAQSGADVSLHVAADGEEALRYLDRGDGTLARLRLILLDLDLPPRNGLKVLADLKARRWKSHPVPVVVLTVSPFEQHIRRSHALGAVAYVIKPPDFTGFAAVVRQIVARFLGEPAIQEA